MTLASQNVDPLDPNGALSAHMLAYNALEKRPAHMVEMRYPGGHYDYEERPEFVLSRTIQIDAPGRLATPIARRDYRRYAAGDFELTPPGTPDSWTTDGTSHLIHLSLPAQDVDEVTENMGVRFDGSFGALHAETFRCTATLRLFDHLWQAVNPSQPSSRLLEEGLFLAIIGQLLTLADGAQAQKTARSGRLPASVMREIDNLIAETCCDRIQMSDLAGLAKMPATTFNRRFKATTGHSPHQYVMNRRLACAQELLRSTSKSVAEVAVAVGFSSQSHMTDLFRSRLGCTPASYRQALLN